MKQLFHNVPQLFIYLFKFFQNQIAVGNVIKLIKKKILTILRTLAIATPV